MINDMNNNIYKIPIFLNFLPYKGFVFIPTNQIFFKSEIADKFFSHKANIFDTSLLIHEQQHIKDIKKIGKLKTIIFYIFSKSFRYSFEKKAYKKQFIFLKKHGVLSKEYVQHVMNFLSDVYYGWCTNEIRFKKDFKNFL